MARRNRPARAGERDLREAILVATEHLLAERRFDELSVADILEAADVSRSSFYFYFESKHAVLAELVRAAVGEAMDVAQPWLEHEDASARETLEQGTRGGAELWGAHAPVLRAIVENWRSDPGLAELWAEMMERFTAAAAERIEHDRSAGRAPLTAADSRTLAALLTWMGERAYYLAAIGHPDFDDQQRLVEALTEIWLATIYREPASPGDERGPRHAIDVTGSP
jgi:TetR/AcrR family transcriptional regulator, ethionamide resistance regulator